SDGAVHSHERHLAGLLELARRRQVGRVRVHVFTDGRDTPPQSGLLYIGRLEEELAVKRDEVATVCGRYFAMDRDGRWDRVARAWDAVCRGKGIAVASGRGAVEAAYSRGETDEFITPTVIGPPGVLEGGDVRPSSSDERDYDCERSRTRDGRGSLRSDRPELRERRHGRAHREDRGDHHGDRNVGFLLRAVGGIRARERVAPRPDRGPRECRADDRPGDRDAAHRAHDEPGAVPDLERERAAARGRSARRRGADGPRA